MNKGIILIDTSYYVFYRYFATLRWYGFQHINEEIDHTKIHENAEFVDNFKKHIDQDLSKLQKKWEVIKDDIIFCVDCARADIWRMELFPDYKGSRKTASTFNANIFNVFYTYIESEKYNIISGKKLEADDVVYLIVKTLTEEKNDLYEKIIVITNDNDYLQLKKNGIEIYNMMGKDITSRNNTTPENYLLRKILIGDISDNIINICPKMGEKTAQKLIEMDTETREKWIDTKGCRKQYELNKTLIDFRNIPVIYSEPLIKYLLDFFCEKI